MESQSCAASIYKDPFRYNGIVWGRYTSPEILQRCEHFQFLPDDIILATYPRSGTTVTQEIVWHIVNHTTIKRDEKYSNTFLRFPFLEYKLDSIPDFKSSQKPNAIDTLPTQNSNRLIKTHLPFSFIRDQFEKVNPKVIVAMRNPKDNVVSCFNLFRGQLHLREGVQFPQYWAAYMEGEGINGDFCDFNLEYWSLRDRENVLVVRYEDIVRQPFQEVRNIALFLGYSLTAETIETIVHNTSFDVMYGNKAVNWSMKSGDKFLRKGKVGDWKDWLTVAQNEAMDAWTAKKLNAVGLHFTYE